MNKKILKNQQNNKNLKKIVFKPLYKNPKKTRFKKKPYF